jgi:hypothetical protein
MTIKAKQIFRFYFLPVAFIFFSLVSYGQKEKEITAETVKALYNSMPKVDGKYEYTEVVQLDTTYKKDVLYKNSKLFFADAFKSAKDVLQYDDREEGKVIGKGNLSIEGGQAVFLTYVTEKWRVDFSLEIFSKDGKYRYRIYDFNIGSRRVASGGSSPDNVYNTDLSIDEAYKETEKGVSKKMNRKMFAELISRINSTVSEIKTYMAKKPSSSSSDF